VCARARACVCVCVCERECYFDACDDCVITHACVVIALTCCERERCPGLQDFYRLSIKNAVLHYDDKPEPDAWIALFFSCLIGVGIGYTAWWCRQLTTPTTFTLVGVVNKVFTVRCTLHSQSMSACARTSESHLACQKFSCYFVVVAMQENGYSHACHCLCTLS
jgi:hypothetical protein